MFRIESAETTKVPCGTQVVVAIPVKTNISSIQPKAQKTDPQQVVPLKGCDCKEGVLFEIY